MSSSAFQIDAPMAPGIPLQSGAGARVGRYDAEIVANSAGEVRLRHTGALKVGTEVPLSYAAGGQRVQTLATVRSCRVLALGGGAGGATLYETCVAVRDAARPLQWGSGSV